MLQHPSNESLGTHKVTELLIRDIPSEIITHLGRGQRHQTCSQCPYGGWWHMYVSHSSWYVHLHATTFWCRAEERDRGQLENLQKVQRQNLWNMYCTSIWQSIPSSCLISVLNHLQIQFFCRASSIYTAFDIRRTQALSRALQAKFKKNLFFCYGGTLASLSLLALISIDLMRLLMWWCPCFNL